MLCSVACCLPAGVESKTLLAENWTTKAAEAAASSSAPPAFNPADPQYNELARRLSKSSAMHKHHALTATVAQVEQQLQGLTGEAKETKRTELEEVQQQLADGLTALNDLQASFEQDPSSLTPWMNALFALADSGCVSFDAGGAADARWPPQHVPLSELLAPPSAASGGPAGVSAWLYRGAEQVLGAFKKRYDLERGPGLIKVCTRLALSPFGEAGPAELAAAVEVALEKSRAALLGPEAAAAGGLIDLVLLHWLDYEDLSTFLPVLLALNKFVARAGQQQEAAEGVVPKVAAVGLVNPTAEAITAAVRAGVLISSVVLPFSLLDTSSAPLVRLAASHGIKVVASGALAHGLISEDYLGLDQPDTAAAPAAAAKTTAGAADNLAAGLDMVDRYGGWPRFQELLQCLKGLADKHSTSVQCVALAWLQHQGVVPLIASRWRPESGAPWASTLGLQHFKLSLPPLPAAAAAAAASTTAEGSVSSSGAAEDSAVPAAAAAAPKSVKEKWAEYVNGMLDDADVAAIAAVAGRPASTAAAC